MTETRPRTDQPAPPARSMGTCSRGAIWRTRAASCPGRSDPRARRARGRGAAVRARCARSDEILVHVADIDARDHGHRRRDRRRAVPRRLRARRAGPDRQPGRAGPAPADRRRPRRVRAPGPRLRHRRQRRAFPTARWSSRGCTSRSRTSRPSRTSVDRVRACAACSPTCITPLADAPAMYQRIRELADLLIADPGEFDRETSQEAGELLRWLADGNYMVLGHAEYSANELASPRAQTHDDDAEGVLRGAARISPLELLPAFRSGAPLVIFKSPLVSTVRRSVRYDCVTVVTPATPGRQADGARLPRPDHQRRGRHRRRGCRWCAGASPRSCCGPACAPTATPAGGCWPRCARCRATNCSRRRPRTCCGWPNSSSTRADRGSVGVFARIHLNRDFVSVLVYFPADRFGPETRRRVRDDDQPLLAGRDHRPRRPHRRTEPGPDAVPDRGAPGHAARLPGPARPSRPRSPR